MNKTDTCVDEKIMKLDDAEIEEKISYFGYKYIYEKKQFYNKFLIRLNVRVFDKSFNSETMYNKKISKTRKEIGHKKKAFNLYIYMYK